MSLLLRFAICSLVCHSLPARGDTEHPAIPALVGPSISQQTPDDAQLQQLKARIGRIAIDVDDIFDDADPLAAPYRIANALHINTHTETILSLLLFKSGDRFDRRVLDETERVLRQSQYVSNPRIDAVRYNDDGTVDLIVHVHDVWTLTPSFSFSRKGGANSARIQIEETNLLGLGKEISLARSSNVDRDSTRLRYGDPNLLGSRWQLTAAHLDSSDGSERALHLGRPFYSLDSRWSASVDAADSTATSSRYSLGKPVDQFDQRHTAFELGGGFSSGLQDGWVRRWRAGVRYEKDTFVARPRAFFGQRPAEPVAALPEDRTLAYPWVGLELIEDRYATTTNLNQIGRTEDLFLGRAARFDVGLASARLSSTRDAIVLDGGLELGSRWADRHYLSNALQVHGRFEGGTVNDGWLDFTTRYHRRHSQSRAFYGAVNMTLSSNLNPEQQLLLGGDSGLRGYPLRYQAGTARTLITLEERFYTNLQLFKSFNVGAAVFFDAGRTWGTDTAAQPPLGWLTDVGIGLRLASARSGLGNVLHIDLAYPLQGPRDLDRMQLLIGTHRSF